MHDLLWSWLSAPDSEFETMPSPQNMVDGEKFVILNDPLYFEKYNGYMYSYNPGSDEIINFDYKKYNKAEMYYRKGILVTNSSLNDKPPMFGNFVLVRNKVLDEKLSLIEGLPKITNDNCFIRKDKLLKLKENDEDVNNLFDKCGYIINHELGEHYCINESLILKAVIKILFQIY